MSVKEIAFVMYPVTDMTRAVAFYRDDLGLKSGELLSEFWTEFEVGGVTFGVGNFEQVGVPGSAGALALEVEDMAAMRARLAERNVETSEPYETPICFISMLKDPDGNKVVLHQRKPKTA